MISEWVASGALARERSASMYSRPEKKWGFSEQVGAGVGCSPGTAEKASARLLFRLEAKPATSAGEAFSFEADGVTSAAVGVSLEGGGVAFANPGFSFQVEATTIAGVKFSFEAKVAALAGSGVSLKVEPATSTKGRFDEGHMMVDVFLFRLFSDAIAVELSFGSWVKLLQEGSLGKVYHWHWSSVQHFFSRSCCLRSRRRRANAEQTILTRHKTCS